MNLCIIKLMYYANPLLPYRHGTATMFELFFLQSVLNRTICMEFDKKIKSHFGLIEYFPRHLQCSSSNL